MNRCFAGLSGNWHCASAYRWLLYGITCSGIGPALATRWPFVRRDAKKAPRVDVFGIGGGMLRALGAPSLARLDPLLWWMAFANNSCTGSGFAK